MADPYGVGTESEDVGRIQRWLYRLHLASPQHFANPGPITGVFTEQTKVALMWWQNNQSLPPTGVWGETEWNQAVKFTQYVSGGKSSNPFDADGMNDQTLAGDRAWVVQQYQYLFDRPPTASELEQRVLSLQQGMSRDDFMKITERWDPEGAVDRIFKTVMGRAPTPEERTKWAGQLSNGVQTRTTLTQYLSSTQEALTKAKEDALAPGAEDARADLDQLLDGYGLATLKDWAWEQIKSGNSPTKIIQDLRLTNEYKARFPAMEARRAGGLSPISEADYIRYEAQARNIFSRSALPPTFYDSPEDYAKLISADLSLDELASRVNEGYSRVTQAPIQVRQAFANLYGVDGDAALAALFIDPDVGEQALLRQTRTAEAKGWGGMFGVNFTAARAGNLADLNMSTDQLRQGLGQLSEMNPLFTESVSEGKNLTSEGEGADAVFGMGGTGANELERRRAGRVAATSGGGGGNISTSGIGVGSAD